MYTDRNLNNYFSGVKKPQLNLSNVTSNNASFKMFLLKINYKQMVMLPLILH